MDSATVESVRGLMAHFVPPAEQFDDTFGRIVRALRTTLGASHATIWVPAKRGEDLKVADAGPNVLHPAYTSLPPEDWSHLPSAAPVDSGRGGKSLMSGKPEFFASIDDQPACCAAEFLRSRGLTKMWTVPLGAIVHRIGTPHNVVGVAVATFADESRAERIDPRLVKFCGEAAGGAIDHALFVEQDAIINQVFDTLDLIDTNRHKAMDDVAKKIAELMRFEACTILLADEHMRSLSVLGTTGVKAAVARNDMRVPFTHSCSGWVAREKRVLAVENLDDSEWFSSSRWTDVVATPTMRQYLGAPIVSRDKMLLGVLRLRNKRAPQESGRARLLNAIDIVRVERVAHLLAPLMAAMLREERSVSTLRRVRHDQHAPALMIRDMAGTLRRKGIDGMAADAEGTMLRLDDIESFAEILMTNADLAGPMDVIDRRLRTEHVLPLSDFVAKICNRLRPEAKRKRLAGILYNDASFLVVPRLWIDTELMQIALYNLLQNAIKYSNEGTIVTIEAAAVRAEGELWYDIHVKNVGIGVREEHLPRLFQKHFRSRQAMNRSTTGVGLGLWTARTIVQRHGGKLLLTQAADPTIFTIRLPAWLSDRSPT